MALYKKIIIAATLLSALIVSGFVIEEYWDDWFQDDPMPIDIVNNPVSLNGRYKIERLVIMENDNILLDSDNDYAVKDDRGEMSIDLNITQSFANISYKMQMTGNAFKKGSAFRDYAFIYDKKNLLLPGNKETSLAERLNAAGLHVYDYDKIVWELPFEENKEAVFILEKENDKVKPVSPSKYLTL